MVLGGLITPASHTEKFDATMQKYRDEQKMFAELKWAKISNQKIAEYKRFIEYFFALNNTDVIHFHCIVLDTHQFNHKKYNDGNKEIGFYKFYYQLLLNCFAKNYLRKNEDDKFIIYLDQRTTSYSLNDLKDILNNGIKKKFGMTDNRAVSIQPVNSKKCETMQINDILIGAIGYQKNGYHLLSGSKKSKIEMCEYIAKEAGVVSLQNNTAWGRVRFKIWNFQLQKR